MIRVGPAGWSYADWEGRVYPRTKPRGFQALEYLSAFVDCVEINSTFYALPRATNAARWVSQVAARTDFRFVAKLLQEFTHHAEPDDAEEWAASIEAAHPDTPARAEALATHWKEVDVIARALAGRFPRGLARVAEASTGGASDARARETLGVEWFE